MILTLDGERIAKSPEAGCTLGQLVDAIRAQAGAERLIVRVALNGEPLNETNADALFTRELAIGDQVDVETGGAEAIVGDALRELAGALADVGAAAPDVATRLNSGDIAGGMRDVCDLVTVWQNGRNAIAQAGGLLQRDLAGIIVDARSVGEHLNELVRQLTEIRDAMVAKDMVLLADLLHYEMPTMCETWSRVLGGVADAVASELAAR